MNKKFLLTLKETTVRHGTAMIEAEDIEDAVNMASDYFCHGPDHIGTRPTEIHFDSDIPYSVTDVSVKRDCQAPGPYTVEWYEDGGAEQQTLDFDSFTLADLFANGIRAMHRGSMGHIEYVEGLQYDGNGDWCWSPSIQMQWGE